MSTDYRDPIPEITQRIVDVLRLQRDAGEALNDGVRPITYIRRGRAVRHKILQDTLPAILVHVDGGDSAKVYVGQLSNRYRVTISIVDNQLEHEESYDTVTGYVGEILYFVFGRSETWPLAGGDELSIDDTEPGTWEVEGDDDAMDQSLIQADIQFWLRRTMSVHEEV